MLEAKVSIKKSIIFFVVFLAVLVDGLYGWLVLNGTSGYGLTQAYRATIVIWAGIVLLDIRRPLALIVFGLVLIWLISLFNLAIRGDLIAPAKDVNYFFKMLFPFLVLSILLKKVPVDNESEEFVVKCVVFYGAVLGVAFIFSVWTGLTFQNYTASTFGISSLFDAGNDIGLVAIITLAFSWYYFIRATSLVSLVLLLLNNVPLVLLGTKATMVGLVITNLTFGLIVVFRKSRFQWSMFAAKFVVVVSTVAAALLLSNFVLGNMHLFERQFGGFAEIAAGNSPRQTRIQFASEVLADGNLSDSLLGRGASYEFLIAEKMFKGIVHMDANIQRVGVEQDLYDLLLLYGYPMTFVILSLHLGFLIVAAKTYWLKRDVFTLTCLYCSSIYMALAMLAGHAMLSAQVGTVVGALYFLVHRQKNRREPSWV